MLTVHFAISVRTQLNTLDFGTQCKAGWYIPRGTVYTYAATVLSAAFFLTFCNSYSSLMTVLYLSVTEFSGIALWIAGVPENWPKSLPHQRVPLAEKWYTFKKCVILCLFILNKSTRVRIRASYLHVNIIICTMYQLIKILWSCSADIYRCRQFIFRNDSKVKKKDRRGNNM